MLYRDILKIIQTYEEVFNEMEEIILKLNTLVEVHNNYVNKLADKFLYSEVLNIESIEIDYRKAIENEIKHFPLLDCVEIIGTCREKVLVINNKYNSDICNEIDFVYDNVINALRNCMNSLHKYSQERTRENFTELMESIHQLEIYYNSFNSILKFSTKTSNLLEQGIKINNNETVFTIKIEDELDLKDMSTVLNATNELYESICGILNVSVSNYPLAVAKIESGSWYEKLVGNMKVLSFMEYIIKSVASYIYRNYTLEGKFNNIPNKIKVIEQEFRLIEKMKEFGYDEEGRAEDELDKQLAILFKHTTSILSKTTKIEVNEEEISITNASQKSIEFKNQKMLKEPKSQNK